MLYRRQRQKRQQKNKIKSGIRNKKRKASVLKNQRKSEERTDVFLLEKEGKAYSIKRKGKCQKNGGIKHTMNIFQGFRKLLFCVIAACTGMVVGYQLSRVLFANVRLCLGIGAVCAVILGIMAFRFYRAGLFLVCAVLMLFVIKTLLHREDWWVYPVSSLAALAAGYSVFLLEKPAENISETSDVREEKGKDKREKKSHRKREADEQKERHARRRQARS